jgi:hypothetical protein
MITYQALSLFDVMALTVLLTVALQLWRSPTEVGKQIAAMLGFIAVEIIIVLITRFIANTHALVLLAALGRVVETIGVWRFSIWLINGKEKH